VGRTLLYPCPSRRPRPWPHRWPPCPTSLPDGGITPPPLDHSSTSSSRCRDRSSIGPHRSSNAGVSSLIQLQTQQSHGEHHQGAQRGIQFSRELCRMGSGGGGCTVYQGEENEIDIWIMEGVELIMCMSYRSSVGGHF
jgi:hypothetical protein